MPSTTLHILLVDDNDDDVFLITEAFAACEQTCTLTSVQDGYEALDYLRNQPPFSDAAPPDIVLLDINMPRLDGFGVLEALRQDDQLADLPVVILSTSEQHSDHDRALKLGARDCLHKPVGFDQLREMLGRFLRHWGDDDNRALKQA